ncbi:MAG: hypothetical protein KDA61_07505 [Planctomycetales bacterium]|nr:hypothetical protein [Planctomycetales bacterium]
MSHHLVRYGLFGQIGSFQSVDATIYRRRDRVVVRSPRGLETAEIVAAPSLEDVATAFPERQILPDGQILRRMTVEDDLLAERLGRRRDEAFQACQQLLLQAGVEASLVDVEHLLDGENLFFYFLGEPPAKATEITASLAQTYETAVEFRQFAQTLAEVCGPGCGTEEAKGQGGCDDCAGCAVAQACNR